MLDYSDLIKYSKGRLSPRQSIIPPNRLETRQWDFLMAVAQAWYPDAVEKLREELRNLTGCRHIFFAPSARYAISQVLSILPHSEVVLPAYTCPVVQTAIRVAGKRIIYVDIEKNGLNATSAEFAEQAKLGRVLVPTHIFGFPTDIEAICDLARAQGCVTIEDAAAALGARRDGQVLGTYGDIGIFSFEKSKRLPAFRGAAIAINNEQIFDPWVLAKSRLVKTERAMPIKELAFAMFHNAATIPWFYGRFTLPRILRRYRYRDDTVDQEDPEAAKKSPFYTRGLHAYQASLISRMLERLDRIRSRIAGLVSAYRLKFTETSIITFHPPKCDDGGLLRFPIAVPGLDRLEVLRRALSLGLYLETNYERPLPEENELSRFPHAVWASRNLVLLPLYTRLTDKEAERIAEKILNF